MKNKIVLFTSFYQDKNPTRQAELEFCIRRNIQNPFIDAIVVVVDEPDQFPILANDKILCVKRSRPKFQDFFDLVNVSVRDDYFAIIANTDIYFDESIELLEAMMKPDVAMALTRHNYLEGGLLQMHAENTWSQDVWIFQGKIWPGMFADFYMGIRGCDNRIAYEMHKVGYKVINPAYNIRCIHYHMSEVRNYGIEAVDKPYAGIPAYHYDFDNIPQVRVHGK